MQQQPFQPHSNHPQQQLPEQQYNSAGFQQPLHYHQRSHLNTLALALLSTAARFPSLAVLRRVPPRCCLLLIPAFAAIFTRAPLRVRRVYPRRRARRSNIGVRWAKRQKTRRSEEKKQWESESERVRERGKTTATVLHCDARLLVATPDFYRWCVMCVFISPLLCIPSCFIVFSSQLAP